ncbi:MAG: hypothetical protein M1817_003598 [Caeruleum heppii]|nr:MAG: hypothetical protein M1817_003598 [Caeruleum heppii]
MAAVQKVSLDIRASLNHLSDIPLWREEKPYEIWAEELPKGILQTNVTFDLVPGVSLTDIRSCGIARPRLEDEGFQVFHHPFPKDCGFDSIDGLDRPERRQAVMDYLSLMTNVAVERLNATKAICYDWRVRRAAAKAHVKTPRIYFDTQEEGVEVREQKIDVAHNIHGDGSPNGIKKNLSYLLTEEEQVELASGRSRVRVVNLWRPLSAVVENEPLALCDVRTVRPEDWEPVDKVFDNWVEESMYLKRNENHRWFWLSRQTRDEVTAFTVWDSKRPDDVHGMHSKSVPPCELPQDPLAD